ncbi:MAG: PQQ-dependent sugar dehydrogenase, partial [bacterium]
MTLRRIFIFAAILFLAVTPTHSQAQLQLQNAFPNLTFSSPVDLQHPGDGTDRIFVVEQAGIIRVFENAATATSARTFLDIRPKVDFNGEKGLLGLAFHPNYQTNGYFYVNYVASSPRRTIIARYRVSATDPNQAVADSESVILTFNQPFDNHNGGQITFGDDGYLYIATGDGGSAGDPQGNGQSLQTLLGKILRIDVDTAAGGRNYGIPGDNPFAGNTAGNREEIYAYGLRNPWRMSFDRTTGWLWAADVGQGRFEEIDLITNGGNYGWKIMEGNSCFSPSTGCNMTSLINPIWDYGRSLGASVTGGYVYRGAKVPE